MRLWSGVLFGSVVMYGAVLLPVLAHSASANLLKNPGFEKRLEGHPWMPAGWDTSESGLPTVFFGRDTFMVHGGRYAVNVASASGLYNMANNWNQSLLIKPNMWGKDMVFTAWTRSFGVEGRAYILLQAFRDTVTKMAMTWKVGRDEAAKKLFIAKLNDPIIDLAWSRQFFTEPETDWVKREVRIFVPPGTDVVFVRCGIIGIGQVLLDDASLTLESPRPADPLPVHTNLLGDPDFEGDGKAWELSIPPFPGMVVRRQSEVVQSGQSAMMLTSLDDYMVMSSRVGLSQVINNRNLAGKRLRFSGFVKTDSLVGNAYLKLMCHRPGGAFEETSVGLIGGTTDWTETSLQVDVPPDTYLVWVFLGYSAPTKGIVYLDNTRLEVLDPAAGQVQTTGG